MAAGDRPIDPLLAEEPVLDDRIEDLEQLYDEEMHRLETISRFVKVVAAKHLENLEEQNANLKTCLIPLMAVIIFSGPVLVALVIAYLWPYLPSSKSDALAYYFGFTLWIFVTIFVCTPNYMLTIWNIAESSWKKNSSSSCSHICHMHSNERPKEDQSMQFFLIQHVTNCKVFLLAVKNAIVVFFLLVSRVIGAPMFLCTLCNSTSGGALACHCCAPSPESVEEVSEDSDDSDDASIRAQDDSQEVVDMPSSDFQLSEASNSGNDESAIGEAQDETSDSEQSEEGDQETGEEHRDISVMI